MHPPSAVTTVDLKVPFRSTVVTALKATVVELFNQF